MKAYWINSTDQTITEVEYQGLADLQRMIGGYIEIAKGWDTGDVLFVDEEGLFKRSPWFIRISGNPQPLGGIGGVVVGREKHEDTSDTYPPTITLDQLRAEVEFISADRVAAWAKANSSEPAVTIYFQGKDPEVIARTGEMFGVSPPKPERQA